MSGNVNWDELNDRISRLSVTESSRDGTVRVTLSASGVLTDLVLKERWHQPQPLNMVAAQVMECVQRAQARIPDLLRQAIFEAVGPNDPAAHLVVADARKRFPEPVPQVSQPAVPRQPRPPERTDDDWDGRPVLEDVT